MPFSFQHLLLLLFNVHIVFHPAYAAAHRATITPTPIASEITASTVQANTQNIKRKPTPTSTPTPIISPTPSSTPTPTPTNTPSPTSTETPTIMLTLTPTATPTPSLTPTPTPIPDVIGNDISYPQCGAAYPTGENFGIVGINNGLATTTNPCLSSELSWANSASSSAAQPKIQLYVNTANPGGLNTASWPKNNTDPSGTITNNPYGTCDGSDSLACAWQYGWNRVEEDIVSRFTSAALQAGIATTSANYPWWLDVETANTWESGSTFAYQSNTADLEGMVAYFKLKGTTVGIYSTSTQWGQIIGSLSSTSTLNGLSSWIPGATDLAGAKANCTKPALTTGGKVTITQYTSTTFDFDYSCQ